MSSRIGALAVALLAVAAPAAVPVAQAATEAGLGVHASATPARATDGDTVMAAYTATNTGPKAQNAAITTTLSAPDGTTKSVTERMRLAPGETHMRSVRYTIDPSYPRGTYYATVEAVGKDGTASDTRDARDLLTPAGASTGLLRIERVGSAAGQARLADRERRRYALAGGESESERQPEAGARSGR